MAYCDFIIMYSPLTHFYLADWKNKKILKYKNHEKIVTLIECFTIFGVHSYGIWQDILSSDS
jgi:hypothetical protein